MENIVIICVSVLFVAGTVLAVINTLFHIIRGRSLFSKKSNILKNNPIDMFEDKLVDFVKVAMIVLISRFVLYIIMLIISYFTVKDFSLADYPSFWFRWDSNSFYRMAQNGYVSEGNDQVFIVFMPLFPVLMKILGFIVGDLTVSASIISVTSSVFASWFLFLIVKNDFGDRKMAFRSVVYYMVFPFSFFLMTAMSDSLFMAFLLGTVYFARTKNWLMAGIFGFCCTLTRLPGVLIVIPVFIEALIDLKNRINQRLRYCSNVYVSPFKDILAKIAGILMIPAGFLVYLYINYAIFGDFLKFLDFQREHWYNVPQPFYKTLQSNVSGILSSMPGTFELAIGAWIPNLLGFAIALFILWYGTIKLRSSYSVYLAVYVMLAFSPTWLLSGARYMIAAFPIYMSFAIMGKNKVVNGFLIAVNSALLLFFTAMYVIDGIMY